MHHDAQINFARYLGSIPFECHYSNHRDGGDMAEYAQFVMDGQYQKMRENDKVIFIVTAGRNGLCREFVEWIKSLDNVDRGGYS